jgi:hypothetical protein
MTGGSELVELQLGEQPVSTVPDGGVTVAVLVSVVVVLAGTVPVTV